MINNIVAIQKLIMEYRERDIWKGMHVHIMFLPGKLKECIEIIDELKANDITYTIRRILPELTWIEQVGINPSEDGMKGQHPKFKEIAVFEAKNPIIVKRNWQWILRKHLGDS